MNGRLSTTSSTGTSSRLGSFLIRLNITLTPPASATSPVAPGYRRRGFWPCAQRDYQQWGIAISSALSCLSVWCVIGSSAAGSRLRQHERARRFSGCTRSLARSDPKLMWLMTDHECMAFITIVVTVVVMVTVTSALRVSITA